MNELQSLVDAGKSRNEIVAELVRRYKLSSSFARLIADISLGVIDGDVIEVAPTDRRLPLPPQQRRTQA